jgi:hypothetical protein
MPSIEGVFRVTGTHFLVRFLGPFPFTRPFCSFRFIEGQKLYVGKLVYFLSAPSDPAHGHNKGLACKAAGQTRAKIWRGLSYVVRDAEFGIAPEG